MYGRAVKAQRRVDEKSRELSEISDFTSQRYLRLAIGPPGTSQCCFPSAACYPPYFTSNGTPTRRLLALNRCIVCLQDDNTMVTGRQSLLWWMASFNNPTCAILEPLNAIQDIVACELSVRAGAAQPVGMFIGARFLVGMGPFADNVAPILVAQVSYPAYRAQFTSAYNSLWYTGNILDDLRHVQDQQHLVLADTLDSAGVAEWLISKGWEAEMVYTLAYYHANGDENDGLVLYKFDQIESATELNRTVNANVG
ncbi:hypothetical protein FIBSPDRAFT_903341 [Athelia psychrophila]|uniref:Uncharacterized protein n=1 Tax=Athelia psychrophila TaxID=1759441 RepID=A0A167W4H5_9AGAM|nr:hypothetical protein FIBSPDRAFT_903341 [Fibularhizoctonia sp. CBS 109695]